MKEERNFKKCIFPFVMTILTFFIGCGFFWFSKDDLFSVRIKILFIGYFPFFLFLILFLIRYFICHTKESKTVITVLTSIFTFFLLGYYFVGIFICALEEVENPITDVKFYKNKVTGNLLSVFPKEIPSEAQNVSFYYGPGILQGGTNYALYYIDENMTLKQFDEMYKNKVIFIGYKNEYTEKNLLNDAFSYAPIDFQNENDFVIYLTIGECHDSSCNHGEFLFSGYNEKTNEVLYRSEKW